MAPVTFEVLGTPTPQGSKTRMPNGAMVEGRSAGQRAMHRSWRTAVAEAARDVADGAAPLTGPLVLESDIMPGSEFDGPVVS